MIRYRFGSLRTSALAAVCALSTGCVGHSHMIGLGPTQKGEVSARQYYLFFGLVQFNEVNVQRMANDLTSYEVETAFSFADILLLPFLLPLTATSRTVTVRT